MGFVLKYCVTCGVRVPEDDFVSGAAMEFRHKTYCKEHVPAEARASAERRRTSTPAATRIRRQSGRTAAVRSSTPSGRTVSGIEGTSSRGSELRDAPAPSRAATMVVISIAGAAILGAVSMIALSGSRGSNTPRPQIADARVEVPSDAVNAGPDNRQAQLEDRARREEAAWREFDSGTPEVGRARFATEAFDRTLALVAEVEDFVRGGGNVPATRQTVLQRLLNNWAETATRDSIERIRTMADEKLRESVASASQFIRELLAGRNEELMPRRFTIQNDLWPMRQLRDLLDRTERDDPARGLTSAQRAAIAALDALVDSADSWSSQGTPDTQWFDTGIDWLRKINGLPFDHPAIEDDRPPAGLPLSRFNNVRTSFAMQLYRYLDTDYQALRGMAGREAVERFVEMGEAFLHEAPEQMPERREIETRVRDMRAAMRDAQPGPPVAPDSGELTEYLTQAESEAARAMRSTDYRLLFRSFVRLQLALNVINVAEERRNKAATTLYSLQQQFLKQWDADSTRVDNGVERKLWRAAGFMLYQVSGVLEETQAARDHVQQLSMSKYGAHPVSEWQAMIDFLDAVLGDDGPGSMTGDALFPYYNGLLSVLISTFRANRDQELVPLLNEVASRCVRDVARRDLATIGGQQRAQRLADHAATCLKSINAEAQPELAQMLERTRDRAIQAAGQLPAVSAR